MLSDPPMRFRERIRSVFSQDGMRGLIEPLQGGTPPTQSHETPSIEEFTRQFDDLHRRRDLTAVNQGVQRLLALKYKEMLHHRLPLPSLDDVELRCFSQNGEDGILLYLFSLLGTVNKKAVEICAGHGLECTTANLIVNHGWRGLLFDGSADNVNYGKAFFATCQDTRLRPPTFVQAWITKDNVNDLIAGCGYQGDIDLLSLDLDGMDWWIWQAIECISPRLVVVEYNAVWGPESAVTVPWQAGFVLDASRLPHYCGASLAAFVKLGRSKGYRLIGQERIGFNAFFLRADVGEDLFPEIPAARCLNYALPDYDWGSRPWVEV